MEGECLTGRSPHSCNANGRSLIRLFFFGTEIWGRQKYPPEKFCNTVTCIWFHKLCNNSVTILVVSVTVFGLHTVLLAMARETNVALGGYKAIQLHEFKLSNFMDGVAPLQHHMQMVQML